MVAKLKGLDFFLNAQQSVLSVFFFEVLRPLCRVIRRSSAACGKQASGNVWTKAGPRKLLLEIGGRFLG